MNTIFCFCVYRVCWQGEERGWWKRGCGQDAKVWKNEKAGKQTSSLLSLTSWFSGELDRVAHGFRQVFSVVIADSHLQQVLCVGLQVLQLHPSCVHFLPSQNSTADIRLTDIKPNIHALGVPQSDKPEFSTQDVSPHEWPWTLSEMWILDNDYLPGMQTVQWTLKPNYILQTEHLRQFNRAEMPLILTCSLQKLLRYKQCMLLLFINNTAMDLSFSISQKISLRWS